MWTARSSRGNMGVGKFCMSAPKKVCPSQLSSCSLRSESVMRWGKASGWRGANDTLTFAAARTDTCATHSLNHSLTHSLTHSLRQTYRQTDRQTHIQSGHSF